MAVSINLSAVTLWLLAAVSADGKLIKRPWAMLEFYTSDKTIRLKTVPAVSVKERRADSRRTSARL